MNALLSVGDILYEYGNYGVYNRVTVTRISPTLAFLSDGFKCPREGWDGCFPKRGESKSVSGLSHYRIESEELISEWFRKTSLKTLYAFQFSNLTNTQLSEIMKIISAAIEQATK